MNVRPAFRPGMMRMNSPATGEVLLKAERILIATGSSPVRPPGFAFKIHGYSIPTRSFNSIGFPDHWLLSVQE